MALLALPTTAALRLDAIRLAEAEGDGHSEADMFRETGLDVTLKRAASFALAIAAPALTGPALDIVSQIAGAG